MQSRHPLQVLTVFFHIFTVRYSAVSSSTTSSWPFCLISSLSVIVYFKAVSSSTSSTDCLVRNRYSAVSSSTSSSWPVCSISSLFGISESYVWSCPVFLARYLISVQPFMCWQFPHNCFSFLDFLRLLKDFLFHTLYLPKLPNYWHECICMFNQKQFL